MSAWPHVCACLLLLCSCATYGEGEEGESSRCDPRGPERAADTVRDGAPNIPPDAWEAVRCRLSWADGEQFRIARALRARPQCRAQLGTPGGWECLKITAFDGSAVALHCKGAPTWTLGVQSRLGDAKGPLGDVALSMSDGDLTIVGMTGDHGCGNVGWSTFLCDGRARTRHRCDLTATR